MENKRLTNKLNSLFWWVLTTLPLILILITFICGVPQYAKNFNWTAEGWSNFIDYVINDTDIYYCSFSVFDNFTLPSITFTFADLLSNVFNVSEPYILAYFLSWMLSVQIYHLIYDVLKFIIEWCHNLIEKAY